MKSNLNLLILSLTMMVIGLTNCTKEKMIAIQEQTVSDMKIGIVGSWQLSEVGLVNAVIEIDTCGCKVNTITENKTSIQWKNAIDDEKLNFTQKRGYSRYLKQKLVCQGSYEISVIGTLTLNSNCQSFSEQISALTTVFLTVKDGNQYFKYRKLD